MATLRLDYGSYPDVCELIDVITYCAEGIAVEFDGWDSPNARGPGLYVAVISDHDYERYADPVGSDTWPVADCPRVGHGDGFLEAARDVAFENDGAVVVSVNGVVQEQMVRLRDLDEEDRVGSRRSDVEYAKWMGTRHMSAVETSLREEVVATVTLSEESGRVSVFQDGGIRTWRREELGGDWRRT